MKFALQADGAQAAGQGIGNLFKAYVLGDQYRQKAEDEALLSGARMAAQRASAESSLAIARKNNAAADLDVNQLALQRDPLNTAMLELGLPTSLAPVFRQRLETGSFGPSYEAPADGMGPIQPAPATPDTVAKLGQAVALMQRMYATDSKVDQGARAAEIEAQMGDRQRIVAGIQPALPTSQAYFATSGKSPFDDVGQSGYTINSLTGTITEANPVMARLFGNSQTALATQRNAAAGASGANAALDQRRLEILEKTGALPGTGADAEGSLSSTILNTIKVPARDAKGNPVRNPLTGEPELVVDQDSLRTFYGWATANGKKPTAAQFAKWEASGRPKAEANKNPAPAPGTPKIPGKDAAALDKARAAIAAGAPREAVIKRLKDNGIDTTGL